MDPTHRASGGLSVVRWWGGVLIAGWCSGGFGRMGRRGTGCWVRASGVQRAALAGVVLCSSRSTIDRQIGCGGVAGACVVVGRVSGRGNGVRGLSGWVGVCCSVVVVVVGGVVTVSRGVGSNSSVVELTCTVVDVSGVLLEGGGGCAMECGGVSGGEGVGGGVVVVVGCGFRSGESLAEFFPLSRALRVRATGCRRGTGVEV